MPTHGIRPPAAKEHTLLAHRTPHTAHRTLRKGEFSVDIPRDLVTRHGPYKVLNPSEALLLAGICSLNPGRYYSKSRLFKAAGMDINQGRNVLARLVDKGFILEVGHSWKPVIPERDEQPTAEQQEQPTAKKEEKEEASPTTEQPPTARKTPRPVKVNREEASAANAPSSFADIWNGANVIGRQNVNAGAFTAQAVTYIEETSKWLGVDPGEFARRCAANLHDQGDRYVNATPATCSPATPSGW